VYSVAERALEEGQAPVVDSSAHAGVDAMPAVAAGTSVVIHGHEHERVAVEGESSTPATSDAPVVAPTAASSGGTVATSATSGTSGSSGKSGTSEGSGSEESGDSSEESSSGSGDSTESTTGV